MPAIASRPTPSVVAGKLIEVMTLEGCETYVYLSDGKRLENTFGVPISYFPDGKQMISGSGDKTVRLWDLETGKEVEKARVVREQEVRAVAVSRDGRWVITAGGDMLPNCPGELKACEVDTGMVQTSDGHSQSIVCINISLDSKQLASGSWDGMARIWSLDTGKLVAGPFKNVDWIGAVRFSPNLKKLAVRSQSAKSLQVWDIQAQKLDRRVESGGKFFSPTPVFWTTKDRTIVTAFALNTDRPKTIYEFDSSTLETVGSPFEGHAYHVTGLALSFDCALLASVSFDYTIKLWAFESRQLVASFKQSSTRFLVFSPDSRQLACTTFREPGPPKIHIRNIPPDILTSIWPTHETPSTNAPRNFHNSDPLNSDATIRPTVRRHRVTTPFATQRLRTIAYQHPPTILRHLRKLLPSSFRRGTVLPLRSDEPCDPLNVPATSSRYHNLSHSTQRMREVHPGMIPGENSRSVLAPHITQSSATASTTSRVQRHLLSWWPSNIGRASVPIIDVPLAPGQLRVATSGAPRVHEDDLVRAEDFDPTSLPNPNSQRASTLVLTDGGEHGSGRSCLCFRF
ncbi:WD40 repeat-like protein [Rhizopogon salebrosus TDB-379]|nr:WD40 repeat-like protein [Rhizopogon salebrosus TDB-379]